MQCQISLVQRLDDTVVANGILGRDFGNHVAACGVREIALYNTVRVEECQKRSSELLLPQKKPIWQSELL